MSADRNELLAYVTTAWRRRRLALHVAWVVCALGWLVVILVPHRYQSETRIYVDSQSLLSPLLKGIAVDFDIGEQLAIMQRTLLSRPNFERVLRATDLDLTVDAPEEREGLIRSLWQRTRVEHEGLNLFRLVHESGDPAQAQRIVQSLLTIFVENNLGASRRDMEQARGFIAEQIALYEGKLKEAERRLAAFKEENLALLPREGTTTGLVQRERATLARLRDELADAETRRRTLTEQMRAIPRLIELRSAPQVVINGERVGADGLDQRIAEMEHRLRELRLRFTDRHPDVIMAGRVLESLREERRRTPGRAGGGLATQSLPNPVYEQMELRLVEAETQIQTLERRVMAQKEEVARLEALLRRAPEIEARHAALNRDYEVLRSNYEALLQRRESARMAEQMDARAEQVVRFRIIEPPQMPIRPSGPNKPLLATAVLFGGIGAGAMLAFLLAQQSQAFSSPQQLRAAFGLPVLGGLSESRSERLGRRRRLAAMRFATGMVGLVVIYGLVLLHLGGILALPVAGLPGIS